MKVIAVILSACMLILNAGHLLDTQEPPLQEAAMECCADSCSGCCDTDENQKDQEKPCSEDQHCGPACECSSEYQLSAVDFGFPELNGIAVNSYDYGNYLNTYSFEYSGEFLQPPRFA
jgi:hypothetical protein